MINKEVKIGFAAPLNKLEWEENTDKQLTILQLSCLLSYGDVGKDVVKCASNYLQYINTGDCTDMHTSDKYEAFCKLVDSIQNLAGYRYYPNNVAGVITDVVDIFISTLVLNMNAGNEYYIGCIVDRFYKNFRLLLMRYGKDLDITLDNIVNKVYNIPFQMYPKDIKYYNKRYSKLAFDVVDERIRELYVKTLKVEDEIHDTYITKTFSIYSSTFQINISVQDSSKTSIKSVKTLVSQPVVLELDEIKFEDVTLDEVVISTLLTTMFTKSQSTLRKLVKDSVIQVETFDSNDSKNVEATKKFIIKNFLEIDSDKNMRSVLYHSLNKRFSNNYNLDRLEVQDNIDDNLESVLHRLCEIILTRYEQLKPVYSTYYNVLKDCGPDCLTLRTNSRGDNLYIEYIDREKDRKYRIIRISTKG